MPAAGELRISDAERDQISAVLEQHEAEGRLTIDELEQRVGVLLEAKTRAQAAAVVADLPPVLELPNWLSDAASVAELAPTTPPREDRAAERRREKLRADENAIGHTFQATRRAINTRLEAASAAGKTDEVADLAELLREAQSLEASAREAVGAGDRSEVQNLLARMRRLAEP